MDEEAITNLLNVVKHIELCSIKSHTKAMGQGHGTSERSYNLGMSDGYQSAGAILRNMLRAMGVAIPEDV